MHWVCLEAEITGSHGLWRSLRVGKKYRTGFSRPWKSGKTEWGLWKFVSFVVFWALWKNYQLICQKLHFRRPDSRLKTIVMQSHKECTSYQFWLIECVGYSKGCAPLPDVQNSCVPLCCFSAPYCGHHVRFCEKFVNFERIFFFTNPGLALYGCYCEALGLILWQAFIWRSFKRCLLFFAGLYFITSVDQWAMRVNTIRFTIAEGVKYVYKQKRQDVTNIQISV